jgi:hypothetical protein
MARYRSLGTDGARPPSVSSRTTERVFVSSEIVGLTWTARGAETSTFDGRDETGKLFAHATNISGRWTIYLTPWACGREGGLVSGPYEDGPAAMAAADRHVATHLAGEGGPP